MILQWLTAPEWANVVKALLHTLWQGAAIAVLLGVVLRRLGEPGARYRCSLAALGGVMLAGLVTWAVLNRPLPQSNSPAPAPQTQPVHAPAANDNLPPLIVNSSPPELVPVSMPWSAWLAMFWLAGATGMIFRAGFQVAGAERLRRSSRPLEDARIVGLLDEARRAVGFVRRVRIAAADKLISPAVVGVLVPTLILPLSLTTTLTTEQIRFVLLHELAHIRRGDYFAGLFQLFAEALLFFNPAVWWISRQMRIEREACCDALAIELSGAPADYARTLVHVAENIMGSGPAAAPAFGDKREPSSLADRVQRMLVPGYRPALRLTWRAMLVALFVGGGLLFLSALGTRVTVAAILSPQERIERIEKKMTEYGAEPQVLNGNVNDEQAPKVKISGRVRMADGSQVPKWVYLNVNSTIAHSSYGTSVIAKNGLFTNSVRAGTIYLGVEMSNCAPAFIGPLDGFATNQFENLELVCEPGFDVLLQPVDAETGQPVTNAKASTIFWMNNNGFQYHFWKSGADGSITLAHCADLPMDAIVNAPGYEIFQQRFDHLRPGEVLRMELRRGGITTGTVVDKVTGRGLADATLRVVSEKGRTESRYQWTDDMRLLATTDASGYFVVNQLAGGTKYWIGVSAPGHESVVISSLVPGTEDAVIKLGPELVVRGRVIGNLDSLQKYNHAPALYWSFNETYGIYSSGDGGWVPLRVDESGVASFEFTNRIAAKVTLTAGEHTFQRSVDAPVEDWVVDLSKSASTSAPVSSREVVLRFQSPSGVAPKGTVYVTVPYQMDAAQPEYQRKEVEIQNGEVHARTFAGAFFEYQPAHTVGFWFKQSFSQTIDKGTGALVIDVPVVPAGAIFASAKNADGTPAGGLFFGVEELKRSPQRDENSPLSDGSDGISDNAPRKWASGPLPLGGTYQIIAWRGNSFCVSQPVKLTDAQPDAEVELQFPPGKSFTGEVRDAGGQPVRNGEVGVEFIVSDNHSFALKSVFTDEQGRFRVDDATPGIGKYSVTVSIPGFRAEMFDVDFSRLPMAVRLQRGRTLAGRVVEAGTGYVIPDAEVRAWTDGGKLPSQTTRTDDNGRFEFSTLGDGTYQVYVDGANFGMNGNNEFKTGQTNLLLKVTPNQGSQLAPKAPPAMTSSPNAGTTTNLSSSTNSFDEKIKPGNSVTVPSVTNSYARYSVLYTGPGRAEIMNKLNTYRLSVSYNPAVPLREVIRDLRQKIQAMDPTKKLINIIINNNPPPATGGATQIDPNTGLPLAGNPGGSGEPLDIGSSLILLSLDHVHLADVLDAICLVANDTNHPDERIKYSVVDYGIVFSAKTPAELAEEAKLFTRTFKVDLAKLRAGLEGIRSTTFGSQIPTVTNILTLSPSEVAREYFADIGINWQKPPGKSVIYNEQSGTLVVTATAADLDIIETVLESVIGVAPQIHIKARFVDVTQESDKSPDFETYLGQLKNGSLLLETNPLDVFLGTTTNATVTGILTDSNFRVALHALQQRSGFEALGEPEATTTSGRRTIMKETSIINVITNFTYQETATNSGIIPQMENVELGSVLDSTATVLADGYTIDLNIKASYIEFLGYDKTTNTAAHYTKTGVKVDVPNISPRFEVRQASAHVNVWDGQTVVLGGMIIPSIQTTKEKVPFLGDLPVLGHLFQSQSKTEIKKNLMIFITATIVDPAANRIHTDDEMPFAEDGIPTQPNH